MCEWVVERGGGVQWVVGDVQWMVGDVQWVVWIPGYVYQTSPT